MIVAGVPMHDFQNRTAFPATFVPGLDKRGVQNISVVVKGTFNVRPGRAQAEVSDDQVPIVMVDEYYGEPTASSVRFASDLGSARPGTDVVLVGHARPPRGATRTLDVTLRAGPVHKVVRVFGDRRYQGSAGHPRISGPELFEAMPLIYERAFGGSSVPSRTHEPRNPVGVGLTGAGGSGSLDGVSLPNLEDPAHLISGPGDRPSPAGFGFIAPWWQPRLTHGGTYDASWREERCPLLPLDFDDRFFHTAHPDLVAPAPFVGGEPVSVTHVTPDGAPLEFRIPKIRPTIKIWLSGQASVHPTRLDTVLVLPDDERLVLCWRATIPCPRQFLAIDRIRVEVPA